MTPNTSMRLDQLKLRNFRCFVECAIDLHPNLTVLVAENGQGKTTILDAIGIALRLFVDTIADARPFHGFDRTDVHLVRSSDSVMTPAPSTDFTAIGCIGGQDVEWSRALKGGSSQARTSTAKAAQLRHRATMLRETIQQGTEPAIPVILPLVAFYGTGRLWSEHRLTEGKKSHFTASDDRLSGYLDCLSSSSSFKGMHAWFETKNTELGDSRHATDVGRNLSLVGAVREAVRLVLEPTGWCNLVWDRAQRCMVVEHSRQGRLPLAALSDGVRNMIALVADVARRCATLNPHLNEEAATQTPGILLIDEVDMHLHPRWQQMVVDLLQKAFPAMQIILSTHSPHVLSTVDKQSIRVIHLQDARGLIDKPSLQTRGVMSADVLASIMRVDPIPQIKEAQQLSQYRALIEDGLANSDGALSLRRDLVAHFEESHPLILDCDRLIRFQAFKLKRNRPEEK